MAYNPVICSNGKKYPNSVISGCAGQTNCKPFSDVPFTPTTVMELDGGERHVFVIKRGLVNKCGQVVFYVSSEDIVVPSNPKKRLKTIPIGSFHRARFDIDALINTPPPLPKFDNCYDIDIKNQTVFFEYTSNNASTITFKANKNLTSLLEGLLIEIIILPVNNFIEDIKYEWLCANANALFCKEEDWVLNSYVLTDSLKKVTVFSITTFFEDNVEYNIGENLSSSLSSSSKLLIVFKKPYTQECVGRCYVSLY